MKQYLRTVDKIAGKLDKHQWVISGVVAIIGAIWASVSSLIEGLGPTLTIVAQVVMASASGLLAHIAIRVWIAVVDAFKAAAENPSRQVVDLGAVRGDLCIDLEEGDYFRATLLDNAQIDIIHPPPRGIVGRFDIELTNPSFCIAFPAAFKFSEGFPEFSAKGTDIISGVTTDGGRSWRISVATEQSPFVRNALILAKDIRPNKVNGCTLIDASGYSDGIHQSAYLQFSPMIMQGGEWESVFTHVSNYVRLRFRIDNWDAWKKERKVGRFGAVFRVYEPISRYERSDNYVRLKVELEIKDEKNHGILINPDWSDFTKPHYIDSQESYLFRIVRDVADPEDTLDANVNIHTIQIEFVGETEQV